MFAAAISLVGLAATVYLVLREAKAIRAQSGTVAKGAIAWSVAFGLFQLFLPFGAPLASSPKTSRSPL